MSGVRPAFLARIVFLDALQEVRKADRLYAEGTSRAAPAEITSQAIDLNEDTLPWSTCVIDVDS